MAKGPPKRKRKAAELPEAARDIHPGHVIHMSNRVAFGQQWSDAVCDCGWRFTCHWHDDPAAQDRAIEAHWAETDMRNVLPQSGQGFTQFG